MDNNINTTIKSGNTDVHVCRCVVCNNLFIPTSILQDTCDDCQFEIVDSLNIKPKKDKEW